MVQLNQVFAGYGPQPCLTDISFSIAPGEILGLIGPNGSGKSTLIRAAAGQLLTKSGQILINNRDIKAFSPRELAREIAYMPQTRMVPSLTVRSLTAHGRYPYLGFGRPMTQPHWQAVDHALQLCGISSLADRTMDTLSVGQRQWAYLALMLCQDTSLLLMDEPCAPLDIGCQLRLMKLLWNLANEGRSILVSLHDLNLAARFCHRLLLMDNGRIAAQGAPEQIFRQPILGQVFGVKVRANALGEYAFDPL